MSRSEQEFVKVFIPAPEEVIRDSNCHGESPWAEPTDDPKVFLLRNEPLHDDYSWGDAVLCDETDEWGRPVVTGKAPT